MTEPPMVGMSVRAPCKGCRYLKPDEKFPENYMRCGYFDTHPVPMLFRWNPSGLCAENGATTRMHVEGPFREDAVQQECPVWESHEEQSGEPT